MPAFPVPRLLCVALLSTPWLLRGDEPPLELPKFTVRDQRELLPPEAWRYARIPGVEILSGVSDRETQNLVRDFQLFNTAIDVVWPALKDHRPVPLSLVLCGAGKFEAFNSATSRGVVATASTLLLKDREQAALILNFGVPELHPGSGAVSLQEDYYAQLKHDYVRYLLSRLEPRLPAWLEEGLAELFMNMRVEPRFIEFAKIEDPNLAPIGIALHDPNQPVIPGAIPVTPSDFNLALSGSGLIPLDQFFAVRHGSFADRTASKLRWGAQAKGLVHMWLYGENGRYHPAFMQFVARSAHEPVTEALFQECFRMSYRQMLTAFRTYIQDTAYRYLQFQAPKGRGLPEPATLALRDATPAEIGRLKGEAHLLAGHPDDAWEEFLAPYFRGHADANLLAAIGLYEKNRGDPVRAQQFLEAAVRQQTGRPRAYVELARLRLARFQAPLSADQIGGLLQLLRTARDQPPPLPETYELLADILRQGAVAPAKSDLGMLNQGVLLFPNRPVLLLHAAELNGKYGDPAEALVMANYGLKLAQTDEARRAFEAVKAMLGEAR